MIRKITHACEGTCSRQIEIEVEDGIVRSVAFTGGCHGNQQGVAALVRGMKAAEAVARLAARHRRIGYLGARGEVSNKIPSFREACSACGCEGIVCEFEGDDFSNFKLEPALFLGDGAPKAWLVGAGEASIYLLNHLLRQGIGIPGEIELVGTSVPRIGELCTPSVSHVELDCSALMRAAFELLGGGEEREIFVPTGFRPLGSCR